MLRWPWLTAILLLCNLAVRAADVGTIENSTAHTTILRDGKTLPSTPGTILQLNDIVRTENGGLMRLVLSDGSGLLLNQDTELRVSTFDSDLQHTVVEMLHGRILAEVAPYTKPTGRFVVRTPTATVTAIGTTLVVATGPPVIDVAQAGATSTITQKDLESLPTTRNLSDLSNLVPGVNANTPPADNAGAGAATQKDLELAPSTQDLSNLSNLVPGLNANSPPSDIAKAVSNLVKLVPQTNSQNQPARPISLLNIPPNVVPGASGSFSLGDYNAVGSTSVEALNHFVVVGSADPKLPGITFLSPGEVGNVLRGSEPTLTNEQFRRLLAAGINEGRRLQNPYLREDFTVNGQICNPGVVVDGDPVSGSPDYKYKILGMGTSTGNALQIDITNQGACPLYFFVPAGTIMHPKGFTERVITGLLFGGTPNLKDFQKMITFGFFVRVPPRTVVSAGPAAPASGEITIPMRSYCVQLHKLAPHPKTEYKFGDEEDQQKLGVNQPVLDRAVQLWFSRQLDATKGHGLDAIIQWSLWTRIENLGQKEFMDEFSGLVHKNYEAKKMKWDKNTQKSVETSGQDLWKLVQAVLK